MAIVAVFLLGMLGASIIERRDEAQRQPALQPIDPWETDSAKWAVNYPRQYDRYRMTVDSSTPTRYGGSDPRDYLKETPDNVILFAGYAFAKEYKQARGHACAVTDVTQTKRISTATPATCWTCKSPDVPRLMAQWGVKEFYAKPFAELKSEIVHPIGCLDCHDPKTMQLRITRPALREAFERQGKEIDKVSHQEMRSLVCAQCHVEYYFRGPDPANPGTYLTFPWDQGKAEKGITAEQIETYYDATGFADWSHAISKTRMLKMQHPDFEIYGTGIHAYRGVACADCHMPYLTEGGVKFTDHYVRSPLLNIANSCAVCHRWSESEIEQRVYAIQDKVAQSRKRAEAVLSRAHFDIAAAMQAGAADAELQGVRKLVRGSQMRWDYVAANNGMGFHSPQECLRVLNAALEMAGNARVEAAQVLARHGVAEPVQYPDYSDKEKAQAVIQQFVDGKPPALTVRKAGSPGQKP
jgi:nitrite reductase (cytochrome c-552)